MSGTTDAIDRPGFADAWAMLRQPPQAEGLLVARLDRLARAVTVQEAALAVTWRDGAKVFTADDGEVGDNPDDPYRTAMRQMVAVFAELERRRILMRMRQGKQTKAATGRKAKGDYPFGYRGAGQRRDRDAAVNPGEQLALLRLLELRRQGLSYREIAAALDAQGLKPRRAAGWSPMSVRAVVLRTEARVSG